MSTRFKDQFTKALSLFLLLSLLLTAGCGGSVVPPTQPPLPASQGTTAAAAAPAAAGRAPASTAVASSPAQPTVTPSPAPPTVTPSPAPPTITPLPLPAPRLLSRRPAPGEEQAIEAPIELVFDQPMDRPSVEAALSIEPALQGAFSWSDARTVVFTPADALERGTRYRVTIAAAARNVEGLALAEPVAFEFSTTGVLAVTEVQPAPGASDLAPDTQVTVVFNRPVVPLTAIASQAGLPDPLTFMPPVRGQGEWLNSAIYVFRPTDSFLPATEYQARVASGLADVTGSVLEVDYTWNFATLRPAVLEVSPSNRFQYVGPTEPVSITFNQPMDHASVQDNFSVTDADGQELLGTFRWLGGRTSTAPETMVFQPTASLARDAKFTATLARGAQTRAGGSAIAHAQTWEFSTVRNPGIIRTSPAAGAVSVGTSASVDITFAGPMQLDGFMDHLSITPAVTPVYTYWQTYDTRVQLSFQKKPATRYTIRLDAGTPDRYGVPLGRPFQLTFTTGNLSPYASLAADSRLGTFSTYTDTLVYASYRNVTRLDVALYKLSSTTFMQFNGFGDWSLWDRYKPPAADLVRSWTLPVKPPANEARLVRLDLTADGGEPLPPGLYYLQLSAPEVLVLRNGQPSRYMFVKSGINLALKQTPTEALVWASDLATGRPVSGLDITFFGTGDLVVGPATTDADGLALVEDGLGTQDLWNSFFAMAGLPGEDDFAIAYNGWDDGVSPWNFDVESEFWSSRYRGYLYTDRPIYRPGQQVYFKGILRADDDAHYTVPSEVKSVTVLINDPQGKELFKKKLTLSDMGTFYDELELAAEAPLGYYYVEFSEPDLDLYASASFQVAEYRAPEYQVTVQSDRDAYLAGDRVTASAEAAYYFGGPVADADVHWSALSNTYFFRYECPRGQSCPWYSWTDYEWGTYEGEEMYGSYGRLIAEGDAQTDAEGRVVFRLPADIAAETNSQILTLEASITDINGQQVSGRTAAVVHKGEFYVGLAARGYLAKVGQAKPVDLLTVDWDGDPVPGVPLTVVFMEHRWYSTRRLAEDGNYYWDWTAEDTPVYTTTVTTGADGRAQATFTPTRAGSYRVRAVGRDSNDSEIRSGAYFWVWGGTRRATWRQESNNRITLIADKEEYQVGDVAEILVPSPYTGTVEALVTVERGHLMHTEVRTLATNSEVLRIPIVDDYAPDVFVSVIIVQGSEQAPDGLASFKMGLVKLPVSIQSKELTITLTPDKDMAQGEHYGPRQSATYDVLVTDSAGRPVEAELSLRLADLAVLALADDSGPSLVDTFWRDRGLGVKTSLGLVVAMEAYNREIRPGLKGGGGGEEGGLVRSRFADTAFWDPAVRTGKDGKARVTVELPDNLTTWRMHARGLTADTLVGQVDVDVLSTLDLLVRSVLPRFFVVGDEARLATIVHNNTAQAVDAQVQIVVEGLTLGVEPSQTVHVPAGGKVEVFWPVTVLPGAAVKVRTWARAASGDLNLYDGREDTLPVYRYSTPEVVATAGRLSEAGVRQEVVQLPTIFDSTQGELNVQIDGSLTAATADALSYLEHYPYECTEQTVSRFLPNVLTYQALDEMGLERPELRQSLSQMVGVGLQRLYAHQHIDGGWGWWTADKSNVFLSAYVLHALVEAQRADFIVDEQVMAKGASFLRANLASPATLKTHWQANRLAYALYVLAEYRSQTTGSQGGASELGLAIRLFDKRHLLDQYGRAMLASALALLEPDEPDRVNTLLSDLVGDVTLSATGAHWGEAEPDYWNMNTDIRTTAIGLWTLSRLQPESDLLPNVVRWLMAVRQDGHWESTQDTSWSLLALVEYMRASGEMHGDFSYTVYLNGQEWGSGDVTPETIDDSHRLQVAIAQLLVDEGNRLVIERASAGPDQTGEGQLYYSANLRYYLPADQVTALDRGIVLARQYTAVDEPHTYLTSAVVGDVIQVKLTVIAPTDLYYVVVEDPLPAGCEGVDLSLKTTSVVGEAPELVNVSEGAENPWLRRYGWNSWYWSNAELRDERVSLFAEYLPRGTYEFSYLMRASLPGQFRVMPATAYEMYFPEVFGRSDGAKFPVAPAD